MAENVEKELSFERKENMLSKLAELENERNAEPVSESPQVVTDPESHVEDVESNVEADVETNQQTTIESTEESVEAESDEPSGFFEALDKAPAVAAKDEGKLPAAAQKRVDRAVAAERQAQEHIRKLEERLAMQSNQSNQNQVTQSNVQAPGEPALPEDLDPIELMTNPKEFAKFVDNLAERKVQSTFEAQKQAAAKFAEESLMRQEAAELKEYAKIAGKAEKEFSQKFPDYEDMLENLPMNDAMKKQLIYCGDVAPKVAYYLGKHPKLAQEIANMRPDKMIREIAKIENLSRTTSAKKSTAPAPSSVNGRVAATNTQRAEPSDSSLRAGLGLPDRRRGRTQTQIVRK